jgi:uncharacterized protein YukE
MQVDPQVLRTFAGQVDIASASISDANVGTKVATAADGLAGSSTQWAAEAVGQHFTTVANKIADGVRNMGVAVRGAGEHFEVTDDALASDFDGLF